MKRSIFLIIVAMISYFTSVCFAENYYIRDGATGRPTGTDWTNAWPELPDTLTRGNTYYIADGLYPGSYSFDDPISGTTSIYIIKATLSDHGTEIGWDNSYGDGQAVFSRPGGSGLGYVLRFATGYYEFDGKVGGYPAWTSGHGFKITTDNPKATLLKIGCRDSREEAPDNIRVLHTEFAHVGREKNPNSHGEAQGVKFDGSNGCNSDSAGGNYFGYNYFHDNPVGVFFAYNNLGLILEYNYFKENAASLPGSSNQGAGITTYGLKNSEIRYNIFEDIEGSLIITLYSWHGRIIESDLTNPVSNGKIYGNVFFWSDNHQGDGHFWVQNAIIGSDGCSPSYGNPCDGSIVTYSDIYIIGNTFSNIDVSSHLRINGEYGTSNVFAKNNIFYRTEGISVGNGAFTGFSHDYNWFFGNVAYQNSVSKVDGFFSSDEWTAGESDFWTEVNSDADEDPSGDIGGSAAMITASATNGYIYDTGSVIGGNYYMLSGYYREIADSEFRYWLYDATNSVYIGELSGYAPGNSNTWRGFSKIFQAPVGSASIQIRLGATGKSEIVYVDHVQLKETIDINLAASESNAQIGIASPFMDYIGEDFRLVKATNNGDDTLGSPFDRDIVGKERIIGSWDRGAFEY